MKRFKKAAVLVTSMLLCISMFALPAFASTVQDGLKVTIQTDKDQYQQNEDIDVTVTVENTNNKAVKNISIETTLPNGYRLAAGSQANGSMSSLEAGASVKLETTAEKPSWFPEDPDNDSVLDWEDSEEEEYVIKSDAKWNANYAEEFVFTVDMDKNDFAAVRIDGKRVPSKDVTVGKDGTVTISADYMKTLENGKHHLTIEDKNGDYGEKVFTIVNSEQTVTAGKLNPQTGNTAALGLCLGLLVASAAGASALMKMNPNTRKKFFSILLVLAMVFTMMPAASLKTLAAEPEMRTIVAKKTVKVGNKDVEISTKVTYEAPEQQTSEGDLLTEAQLNLEVGMSKNLETTSELTDAQWASSDEAIVTVSERGTVTAVGEGTATVSVTVNSHTDSCVVTVTKPNLSLNHNELTLSIHESEELIVSGTTQEIDWSSSDETVVSVEENGKVTAVSAGVATVSAAIAGGFNVSCDIVVLPDAGGSEATVTRSQWLREILTATNHDISLVDIETASHYFADLQHYEGDTVTYHPDAEYVEYALAVGIITDDTAEDDIPMFYPDEPVSREFAAVSGVRALRFEPDANNASLLSEDIVYPEEVMTALELALMFTDANGDFRPQSALTEKEMNQFLEVANGIIASEQALTNIQPGQILKEEVEYLPDTIDQNQLSGVDYEVKTATFSNSGAMEIVLNHLDVDVQPGHNLLLPASEEYPNGLPIHVESVQAQDDGSVLIIGSIQDDISQILSEVEFTGAAELIPEGIEGLNGVQVSYDPNGSETTYGSRASFPIPGKLTFDFGDGIQLTDKTKLEGSVEVTVPNITVDADIDFGVFKGFVCKKFEFSVTEKVKFDGGVKLTVVESELVRGHAGSKEIGRLPFKLGATGFSIDFVVSVYYSVTGEVKIVYTIQATEGIQFKNNKLRYIGNVQQDLQLPNIEGKAEVGGKFALNLVFMSIWDIIGADVKIGPAATVSAKHHVNLNLSCLDATVYLSGLIELNDETLLGELLKEKWHYTLQHEFWKEDNSPLRAQFHFENGQKVDRCSTQMGDVKGRILSDKTGEALANARIVLKSGSYEYTRTYTNNNGYYTLNNVTKGDYTMEISADHYLNMYTNIKVEEGSMNQQEDVRLIWRDEVAQPSGQGTVVGTITNATNNAVVGNVDYLVRKNWSNSTGDVVTSGTSDQNGNYSINLAPGNYTIIFQKDGYAFNVINVAVSNGNTVRKNVLMSPTFNFDTIQSMRIVLSWGAAPRDLDSHLFAPNASGYLDHVYYSNMRGDSGQVKLDVDDTSSYGPETITVNKLQNGKYSYLIHDYTNRNYFNSYALSNSGATVEIYFGDTLYTTVRVPVGQAGNVWHVFNYDSATDSFVIVNKMANNSNPNGLNPLNLDEETDPDELYHQALVAEILTVTQEDKEGQAEEDEVLDSKNEQTPAESEEETEDSEEEPEAVIPETTEPAEESKADTETKPEENAEEELTDDQKQQEKTASDDSKTEE